MSRTFLDGRIPASAAVLIVPLLKSTLIPSTFRSHAAALCSVVILSAVAVFSGVPAWGQSLDRFTHITREDGLSNDTVLSILQDASGFLWVGTLNGLNRYDGYRVEVFRGDRNGPDALPHSRIDALFESPDGTLWIGTHAGLVRYDPESERFTKFSMSNDPDRETIVHGIAQDASGILWLSTWNSGLIRFDPREEVWEAFEEEISSVHPHIGGSVIRTALPREDGLLWATGYNGLLEFDPNTGAFSQPDLPESVLAVTRGAVIFNLLVTDDDLLWFTSFEGVYSLDVQTGDLKNYRVQSSDAAWNTVRALYADSRGNMWAGTAAGLAHISPQTGVVTPYYNNPANRHSISRGAISTIHEDRLGTLWIGSEKGGASGTDLYREGISTVVHDPSNPSRFQSGHIWDAEDARSGGLWLATTTGLHHWDFEAVQARRVPVSGAAFPGITTILRDSADRLWLGSEGSGLCRFDEVRERCRWLDSSALPNPNVYALAEDGRGMIVVGTFDGAAVLDPNTWRIDDLYDDSARNRPGFVQSILPAPGGRVWIGAENGLYVVEPHGMVSMIDSRRASGLMPKSGVVDMVRSSDGRIWFVQGDVHALDPASGNIDVFDASVGLPEDVARALAIDRDEQIWVLYDGYLARIDPRTKAVKVLSGLLGNISLQNWTGASHALSDGRLVFGFEDGAYLIDPSSLSENPFQPRTFFTSLRVDGQVQRPSADGLLRSSMSRTTDLEFGHASRSIEIGFASSYLANPKATLFRTRLDGFSDTWTTVHNPIATYTHLPPGRYTFRVVARSVDGMEGPEARLFVRIHPPWWKATWFRIMLLLAVFGLAFAAYRIRMQAVIAANRRLEKSVEDRTRQIDEQKERLSLQAEKLIEADRSKSRFFSNVSHELKTPLTLIQAYLLELGDTAESRLAPREMERIERSVALTERLDGLVLQLLDLARSDAGRLHLNLQTVELCAFLQRIVTHFSVAARMKDIKLILELDTSEIRTECDPVKLDQIVSNLIGNALKFTEEEGTVWVSISTEDDDEALSHVVIRVADTGRGIPADEIDRIFERFYQVGEPLTRTSEGLGLGLSLSADFARLHGGTLSATSEEGSGSVFTLRFPLRITVSGEMRMPEGRSGARYVDVVRDDEPVHSPPTSLLDKVVLVVEDNNELCRYLKEILSEDFKVHTASDGRAAWDMLQKERPDIILSDVMMPRMDGLQLLENVRGDERLSSLPFVLLTARASVEDEVAGLSARADDFIAKPFSARVLTTRLVNLVQNRREFSRLPSSEAAVSEEDRTFLDKLNAIVYDSSNGGTMTVAELAEAVYMSERSFQRRVKQITGESAAAYVRYVRLSNARRLLEEQSVSSVSRAAQQAGFQNVSHFSRLFVEAFGIEPSSYIG